MQPSNRYSKGNTRHYIYKGRWPATSTTSPTTPSPPLYPNLKISNNKPTMPPTDCIHLRLNSRCSLPSRLAYVFVESSRATLYCRINYATQTVGSARAKSTTAVACGSQSRNITELERKKISQEPYQRSMCFLIELTSALFGTAPTTVMTLFRSLKSMRVGMFRIFNSATVFGFSSVHSSNTLSLPPCSAITSSTTGPTMRHGPHLDRAQQYGMKVEPAVTGGCEATRDSSGSSF